MQHKEGTIRLREALTGGRRTTAMQPGQPENMQVHALPNSFLSLRHNRPAFTSEATFSLCQLTHWVTIWKHTRKSCVGIKPTTTGGWISLQASVQKLTLWIIYSITYVFQPSSHQSKANTSAVSEGEPAELLSPSAVRHGLQPAGHCSLWLQVGLMHTGQHLQAWLPHLCPETTPGPSQSLFPTRGLVKTLQGKLKSEMVFCIQMKWIV